MTAPDDDNTVPTTDQAPQQAAEPAPDPVADPTPVEVAAEPEPAPEAATEAGTETGTTHVVPPVPAPRPGPRPGRPGPRPGAPGAGAGPRKKSPTRPGKPARPAEEAVLVDEAEAATWGRVTDDGTVFVRTVDGEREVGQYAAGAPDEALAFYTRRYAALATEVVLLERRVQKAAVSPEEARTSITKIAEQLPEAHAVGDLAGLQARLDALTPLLEEQREAKRAERARKIEESRARKEQIVAEAEKVGAGRNWRDGANRLRDLLEEWKTLPRLDRASDDALWRRFSTARTTYTRSRKSHFSELDEKRGESRVLKERLITEAEALSSSTEWGPTAGRYRDLMDRWKAAGPAAKAEDDALWKRFRGAQDAFFEAREAANTAQDAEFEANAVVKDALLVEAEKLLPIRNLDAAKRAFRDIGEKWEAAGKVPRHRMKDLEARIRVVETAIRGAEDAKWKNTDPEKSARADDMIAKLEKAIADIEAKLEKATAAGEAKKVTDLESDLAGRRLFLDAARRTAADFS